jgi:hypothetical protein
VFEFHQALLQFVGPDPECARERFGQAILGRLLDSLLVQVLLDLLNRGRTVFFEAAIIGPSRPLVSLFKAGPLLRALSSNTRRMTAVTPLSMHGSSIDTKWRG